MTSNNVTCRCTGECGSRWCVGYLTWGKACAVAHRSPHPADGQHQLVRQHRCTHCRHAAHARAARESRTRELLARTAPDGHTQSLFSLVGGGEST